MYMYMYSVQEYPDTQYTEYSNYSGSARYSYKYSVRTHTRVCMSYSVLHSVHPGDPAD